MSDESDRDRPERDVPRRKRSHVLTVAIVAFAAGTGFGAVIWYGFHTPNSTVAPSSGYPIGVVDKAEASAMGPPGNVLRGYTLSYQTQFPGSSLPRGWYDFTGVPGGDPGGQFAASHVIVSGGVLQLVAYEDPAYHDEWVTGGLCQCGLAHTYGAFFVRSRMVGEGPNDAELLWPKANIWPPEIDFNETGGSLSGTSSTVHYGVTNNIDQRHLNINMKKWHTWGVVWTPTSIAYIVDGRVWSRILAVSEIPNQPMTLDFEQRALCSLGRECPSAPASMQINWVAEYSPS
ncbi:MAG: family 16 glycosylhydrolase [Acidimicrobiales bacterium]